MHTVVGPILTKEGGYAFDIWTPEEGLSCGYAYRRIEDAHYARNAEIRSRKQGRPVRALTCNTLDEFTSAVAERDATFCALVSNLEARSIGPSEPHDRHRNAPIATEAEAVTAP
jgi:hypothetical protein